MMLVSTRVSIVMAIAASACTDPVSTAGDDLNNDDDDDVVELQCAAALPCPAPSSGSKTTVCGQIYDFETDARLGESSVGTACTTPTATGPCSLSIHAYDALAFASNPASATPLAHAGVEIDTCGRYRITDIDVTGTGPFIGIVIDDAAGFGPAGTTVTTMVAASKNAGNATDALEAWVVREATTTQWTASGGPALTDGVFVPVFRAHQLGTPGTDPRALQSGVTLTKQDNVAAGHYFAADTMERVTIDTAAVATGANGTVLVGNATIADLLVYSGTGGLSDPTSCHWERRAGASIPGGVFIQVFRPMSIVGETCMQ